MLSTGKAVMNVYKAVSTRSTILYQYQCVRLARRKPVCLPTAKSKLFRVPERKNLPEEETLELRRLHNNYRTYIKSIRDFLKQELEKSASASEQAQELLRKEREEHLLCVKKNEEWNAEVAKVREIRLAKQEVAERDLILDTIIKHEQQEKEFIEKVEDIIAKEKEKSKYYITANNIDEAIEKALNNEVDYNFSLDIDGNKYHGRMTKPNKVLESAEKVAVSSRAS